MPLFVTIISVYLGLILLFLIATGALHAHANGRRLSIGWASIFRFVREWFGIAILGCLWPWGIIQPKMAQAKKQTAGPHHPVLLVPGYLMNRSSLWPLARHLRRRGWTWAIPINHTINTPIPTMAQRLSQQVDTLCQVSGFEQVDLVCHSMGGIVSTWYVNQLNGSGKVRRIITLGTPWKGTQMSRWGPGHEARDLAMDSTVIQQVQHPAVPVCAIWSTADELLIPSDVARCDGQENLELKQCGHMEMLLSPRVYRLVRQVLSQSKSKSQ